MPTERQPLCKAILRLLERTGGRWLCEPDGGGDVTGMRPVPVIHHSVRRKSRRPAEQAVRPDFGECCRSWRNPEGSSWCAADGRRGLREIGVPRHQLNRQPEYRHRSENRPGRLLTSRHASSAIRSSRRRRSRVVTWLPRDTSLQSHHEVATPSLAHHPAVTALRDSRLQRPRHGGS